MARIMKTNTGGSVSLIECNDCDEMLITEPTDGSMKEARNHVKDTGHQVRILRHIEELLDLA